MSLRDSQRSGDAARHPSIERTKGRPVSRRLTRLSAVGAALGVTLAVGFFVVLPWLGRRGDLNWIIEHFLSSALTVPVRIESLDSQPLSHMKLTRLRSVSAEAQGRLRFAADEISFYYDPVELLSGHIRRVIFKSPLLMLDLDAGVDGVFRVPELLTDEEAPPREVESLSPFSLPFSVDELILEGGSATVRFAGRELPVTGLRIEVFGLGHPEMQRYRLQARLGKASLDISGSIEPLSAPGAPARFRLHRSSVTIEELPLAELLEYVAADSRESEPGKPSRAALPEGSLDLEGTLEGLWPERIELELATSGSRISAGSCGPGDRLFGLDEGKLELDLTAEILDALEEVSFQLEATAEGFVESRAGWVRESSRLSAAGRLDRLGEDGVALTLGTADLVVAGGGAVAMTGRIAPLLADAPPAFDVGLSLDSLEGGWFLEYVPEEALTAVPAGLDGSRSVVSGDLALGGTVSAPRASGHVRVRGVALLDAPEQEASAASLEVAFDELVVQTTDGSLRLGGMEVLLEGVDLSGVGQLASQHLTALPELSGSSTWRLTMTGVELSEGAVKGGATLDLTLGRWDVGSAMGDGLSGRKGLISLDAEVDSAADDWPFSARVELDVDELLLGPVYAEPDKPLTLELDGQSRLTKDGVLRAVEVHSLLADTSLTGTLEASGGLELPEDSGAARIRARIRAPALPTRTVFETCVVSPYAQIYSALQGASLEGESSTSLLLEGPLEDLTLAGRFRLEGGRLTLGDWRAEGIDLDLPFLAGAGPAKEEPRSRPEGGGGGSLAVRSLRRGPFSLESLSAPFRLSGTTYELDRSLALELLGGKIVIESLVVRLGGEDSPEVLARVHGQKLPLERWTRLFDLPAVKGQVGFRFDELHYRDGGLEIAGAIAADALGGRLRMSGLGVESLLEPYGQLRLDVVEIEDLLLAELGKTFRFGLASGVLRGRLEDLKITAGEVSAFRLDVETVPSSGVPQFLDRRAIDSIRRVISSYVGPLEGGLFSRFRYTGFGFTAELEGDTFRLHGKHSEGDVEYLMYADWYLLPQVEIVNARPDRAYDWSMIVKAVEDIYREDSEP